MHSTCNAGTQKSIETHDVTEVKRCSCICGMLKTHIRKFCSTVLEIIFESFLDFNEYGITTAL